MPKFQHGHVHKAKAAKKNAKAAKAAAMRASLRAQRVGTLRCEGALNSPAIIRHHQPSPAITAIIIISSHHHQQPSSSAIIIIIIVSSSSSQPSSASSTSSASSAIVIASHHQPSSSSPSSSHHHHRCTCSDSQCDRLCIPIRHACSYAGRAPNEHVLIRSQKLKLFQHHMAQIVRPESEHVSYVCNEERERVKSTALQGQRHARRVVYERID